MTRSNPSEARKSAGRPLIMGILNLTPDSFSDGGQWVSPQAAFSQAALMLREGADILDVGAESTRPGAAAVGVEEELRRLAPVLPRLRADHPETLLSLDTRKPEVMEWGAAQGVDIINIVGGLPGAAALRALAAVKALSVVSMHMHLTPDRMQTAPLDGQDAVSAVDRHFSTTETALRMAGFESPRIWLDPGFGFGKTDRGNVALMRMLPAWSQRYNLTVGVSRKSLIGRTLSIEKAADRDPPSKMLELGLALLGAGMIRTHAVGQLRILLDLCRP